MLVEIRRMVLFDLSYTMLILPRFLQGPYHPEIDDVLQSAFERRFICTKAMNVYLKFFTSQFFLIFV
ncbi:unnamed protein product [Caenorhabditis brenneri]